MHSTYSVNDPRKIFSPGLLFFPELIRGNIQRAIELAGTADRLRPHVKTHKTREITRMELSQGITKHKCATLAEAEMLASCEVPDVFVAYNIVGPNCERLVRLIQSYRATTFSVQADHPTALRTLSQTLHALGESVDVLIDLDVGQHRTGVAPGPDALTLYEILDRLPGLRPGGIHAYDGHNHQEDSRERCNAAKEVVGLVIEFRDALVKKGLTVPRLILGGTPTFSFYAGEKAQEIECAPGTCILHDIGYGTRYRDIVGFTPAAVLLTRVVSCPGHELLTLDLGTKAVASDPPAGSRCQLLNVPDYREFAHNEEHLVVHTAEASRFVPGDEVLALPTHICPTCALYRFANVIENGDVVDRWEIAARDRVLTV